MSISKTSTPFRISINLMPEAPVTQLVAVAQEAENLGYARVWVYDEGLAARDVYVVLTAIAAATKTVHVGPGITNPYTRHPATTAMSIATLHEMTGGRAFLGIGAGGSLTLGPLGVDRSKPLTAVRETIAACRELFDGESVTMEARHFSLSDARLTLDSPTHAEIWLAGRGPHMLQLGGELATGVMLEFLHKDTIAHHRGLVTEGAARSGNDPRLCYSTMIITTDEEMESARPHMTYRIVDSQPDIKAQLGITPEDVEKIRSAMTHGLEAAGEYVKTDWVRPFVIAGSVDECAVELRDMMVQNNFEEFILPVLHLQDSSRLMNVVANVMAMI
jgi:5,10-methylenetetrahydromethanopterin reductase